MTRFHAHRPSRSNPLKDAFVIGLWIAVFIALTAVQGV
jgi:flagellar biosynthesis protein FliQ